MDERLQKPGPWKAGDRVFVENEGPGTVVEDQGFGRYPSKKVRWLDSGVIVKVDSDGEELQCAHDMLSPIEK